MNLSKFMPNLGDLMGKMPKELSDAIGDANMFGGYEFKDGMMKPAVEYWTAINKRVITEANIIYLYAKEDIIVPMTGEIVIESDLTLLIKPSELVFSFFLLSQPQLETSGVNMIFPQKKETVTFRVKNRTSFVHRIMTGDCIGYGYFTPFFPINHLSLTKQDAT